jgi:2-polyprenyl-6-methoxyphenol hydroxylase-like FAD-dependent oxidoreductase
MSHAGVVIIVGCGIAGPVLALLLHEKGYTPVVVEKVKRLGNVGGSLMLQPNGYVRQARWADQRAPGGAKTKR